MHMIICVKSLLYLKVYKAISCRKKMFGININLTSNPLTLNKYLFCMVITHYLNKTLYSLSSYFRGTPNSTVSDINNLNWHVYLTHGLLISHCIITNMYDVFHIFFLQNLWTFSSLIILILDVYFKQLVPRKYEAPVYKSSKMQIR